MLKDKFMRQVIPSAVDQAQWPNEPEWLTDVRRQAFERLADLALPTVAKFDYHTWRFVAPKSAQPECVDWNQFADEAADYQLATTGDQVLQNQIAPEMEEQGVICCDLATAVREHADLLKPYLTQPYHLQSDRLNCLETALVNGGMFIYVPAGVKLTQPLKVWSLMDNGRPATEFHRIVMVAESDSHFDVVQKLSSTGAGHQVAHVNVDIYAKANSAVQFFALDSLGATDTAYVMRHADVGKRAQVNWMVGSFNDCNTVSDMQTDLNGEGAKGITRIVSIADHRQHQGINTKITNYGRHSDGEISQRGAILDRAQLVFNGIGKVAHGAHGANNQQENSVLMLSDEASGDANPILLIDENDVIAGHKASIGRIDERQLYYLMSRGIKPEVAKKLVIRGFLSIILTHIPSDSIRKQMIATIERKLADD